MTACFNSGEHVILGDQDHLQGIPGNRLSLAGFTDLTYGEIVALAGDYYGNPNAPICEGSDTGTDTKENRARQLDALMKTADENELVALRQLIQEEVDGINAKLNAGENPSEYYEQLGHSHDTQAEEITGGRYLDLAGMNFDHFGAGAVAAYKACHTLALKYAMGAMNVPEEERLNDGYVMNAIADHFLSDLFSAGHLRVQRKQFHGWSMWRIPGTNLAAGDYFAKYVHDEDSKYGLQVQNQREDHWSCYGDSYYFDPRNQTNRQLCQEAMSCSKLEIYEAWTSGAAPSIQDGNFGALQIIPDLQKVADPLANPDHRILLRFDGGGSLLNRQDVNDLKDFRYETCFSAPTLYGYLLAKYNL